MQLVKPGAEPPAHVAILGLGPSLESYVNVTKRLGSRRAFSDEVWGINAVGDIAQCDRVFHMDDVKVQEIRAAAEPKSNIARMLEWMREHPGPVYTSVVRDGYPGLVALPIEDVCNSVGMVYMNNTGAHAIAFAIHLGVKKISLFGFDYTYENAHHAEKGRGCAEFLLGIAYARGIDISIPRTSSLLDSCEPFERRLYGYDCVDQKVTNVGPRKFRIELSPKAELPTAEEIEHRYDHSRHPSPHVSGEAA